MTVPIPGYNYPVGVAYIRLPSDLDRTRYIGLCYRTNTLCISTEDGGFFTRVPCDIDVLNFAEFPELVTGLGSAVLYVNEPIKNQLFIIAHLEKTGTISDGREGLYKIKKTSKRGVSEFTLSAKEMFAGVSVVGEKSLINFKVQGEGSEIKIESSNLLNIFANNISILGFSESKIETTDFENNTTSGFYQTPQENRFEGERFIVSKGNESMVLGDKLKTFLDDFIDTVSSITVSTAIGPQPILNKVQILQFKSRTKEFLSEIGFLE